MPPLPRQPLHHCGRESRRSASYLRRRGHITSFQFSCDDFFITHGSHRHRHRPLVFSEIELVLGVRGKMPDEVALNILISGSDCISNTIHTKGLAPDSSAGPQAQTASCLFQIWLLSLRLVAPISRMHGISIALSADACPRATTSLRTSLPS